MASADAAEESGTGMTVGIAGLGEMAHRYADDVVELGHDIVGVDADTSQRARFERAFETETYEDPESMLGEGIDAVLITAPNRFHEPVALAAFDADIDVFIEKPLAHNVESAERIAAAARGSDAIGMVGNYFQFNPYAEVLRSYIEDGYFGDLFHLDVTHVWRRHVPRKGSWFTTKTVAGGGALMDRGPFAIGLLLEFMEYRDVDRVMANTRRDFGDRDDYSYLRMYGEEGDEHVFDVEDSVVALVEFEEGCTATIDLAWATNVSDTNRHSYELRGTEAGATLDLASMSGGSLTFNEARSRGTDHFVDTAVTAEEIDVHLEQTRQFLSAARSGEPPEQNTIEDGLAVSRLIDRIYRAAEE